MYYNVGVLGKKYNNMNYLRLPLLFGAFGGLFFVGASRFFESLNSASFVASILLICSILVLVYFVALPILSRTYFSDSWVEDSDSVEVDADMLAAFEKFGFSNRETQVCRLLLEGHTLRQIALALKISPATVNTYCTAIYRKAGVNSKIQLLKNFSRS
jgi:DNA-binding CsgD family transcriptional regulator